jgi:hypothetical protein
VGVNAQVLSCRLRSAACSSRYLFLDRIEER